MNDLKTVWAYNWLQVNTTSNEWLQDFDGL